MTHVLVVGGSGYLGSALCRLAHARGDRVTATTLSGTAPPHATGARLDVRDSGGVDALIADARPDVVVNTAYVQGPADVARGVNVDGGRNVARAATRHGARLVHMSSDVVFDGASPTPLTEDAAVSPVHDYGRSKADAEREVSRAYPAAAIVRTSLIYGGPDGPRSRHEQTVLDAAAGEVEMTFFDDELRCPVRVDDLAAAVWELAGTDHAGALHLAGPEVISRLDLARRVAEWAGADPSALRGAPCPPGRPRALVLDSGLAARLLTTRLRGVGDGGEAR